MKKLFVFAVSAGGLGLAQMAWALPTQQVSVRYFSDATFTTPVGSQVVLTCSGGHGSPVGAVSEYEVYTYEPCRSSDPIEVLCFANGVETWCGADICDVWGVCG